MPMLRLLFAALSCSESGSLYEFRSVSCWQYEALAYRIIGALVSIVFILATALLTLVYFRDGWSDAHLLSRPHSRVDFLLHLCKTVQLLAFALTDNGIILGILLVLCNGACLSAFVFALPYSKFGWLCVRTGTYSLTTLFSVGALLTNFVAGSRMFIVVLAALLPVLACAVGLLFVRRLWLVRRFNRATSSVETSATTSLDTGAAGLGMSGMLARQYSLAPSNAIGGGIADAPGQNSRFRFPFEVEIVAHYYAALGDTLVANDVFQAGLRQFPRSVFVHTCYLRFLSARSNVNLAQVFLDKARTLKASVDMRFCIYRKAAEFAQHAETQEDRKSVV